jgi:hypothetical protein
MESVITVESGRGLRLRTLIKQIGLTPTTGKDER